MDVSSTSPARSTHSRGAFIWPADLWPEPLHTYCRCQELHLTSTSTWRPSNPWEPPLRGYCNLATPHRYCCMAAPAVFYTDVEKGGEGGRCNPSTTPPPHSIIYSPEGVWFLRGGLRKQHVSYMTTLRSIQLNHLCQWVSGCASFIRGGSDPCRCSWHHDICLQLGGPSGTCQ